MNDNYIPYGPEWEKEVSKLPKNILVEMLKRAHMKRQAAEDFIQQMEILNMQGQAAIEQWKTSALK